MFELKMLQLLISVIIDFFNAGFYVI